MRAASIIPARYESNRLPGKPILERARELTGKYIIQHVYERAALAPSVERVIVATDDERIVAAVRGFGGEARMTSSRHRCGTERVAEVAAELDYPVIVNVQGDEPGILPDQVEQVICLLVADQSAAMATLASPMRSEQEWRDPNNVKVVVDDRGDALYFSRSPIPYVRDASGAPDNPPLHHLGIYGYRREFLLGYVDLPPSPLEAAEKLEQLRALAAGHRIKVGITAHCPVAIDTADDLEAWLRCTAAGQST